MDLLPFLTREPTFYEKAWAAVSHPINTFYHPLRALVSLPALSFLVIPAFSSYSTTLNFLFFYMTWAILIRSNPPLQVELVGSLAIRVLFYLLPSAAFLAFDSAAPSLAMKLKEHGADALAMGDEQGGPRGRWWKITLVSTLNVLLGLLLQTGTELLLTRLLGVRSALKITTTLPLPWSIAKDVVLALLLREVLTYVFHRYLLHAESRLGKWHVKWQHSIVSPFSFVAHYDHPLAYLIHVFLPMYLPAVILRVHLLTFHLYLIIVSLEETFAYSGYNVLPTAFILGGMARRQERHLMGEGKGNFGCFGLSDFLMGTSLGEDLVEDVVDEAEDKQVKKKAKGKAKSVRKKVQRKAASDEGEGQDDSSEKQSEAPEEDESLAKRSRSRRRSRGRASNDRKQSKANGDPEDEKAKRKPSSAAKKPVKRKTKKPSEDDE